MYLGRYLGRYLGISSYLFLDIPLFLFPCYKLQTKNEAFRLGFEQREKKKKKKKTKGKGVNQIGILSVNG